MLQVITADFCVDGEVNSESYRYEEIREENIIHVCGIIYTPPKEGGVTFNIKELVEKIHRSRRQVSLAAPCVPMRLVGPDNS